MPTSKITMLMTDEEMNSFLRTVSNIPGVRATKIFQDILARYLADRVGMDQVVAWVSLKGAPDELAYYEAETGRWMSRRGPKSRMLCYAWEVDKLDYPGEPYRTEEQLEQLRRDLQEDMSSEEFDQAMDEGTPVQPLVDLAKRTFPGTPVATVFTTDEADDFAQMYNGWVEMVEIGSILAFMSLWVQKRVPHVSADFDYGKYQADAFLYGARLLVEADQDPDRMVTLERAKVLLLGHLSLSTPKDYTYGAVALFVMLFAGARAHVRSKLDDLVRAVRADVAPNVSLR